MSGQACNLFPAPIESLDRMTLKARIGGIRAPEGATQQAEPR